MPMPNEIITSEPERPAEERRPEHLERGLGLLDATMIVVGSMIGSGIFITSAESTRLVGAPGWLLAAWALAGLLTITGALCCAELAAMMPRAGGQYVFLREAYGPAVGFLFGWSLFLVIQTGTIAAVAVAFARFTGVLWPWVAADRYLVEPVRLSGGYAVSLTTEQLVAVLLILLLTFTNTLGLKTGKLIQNTFTFTKTAALAALVLVGLALAVCAYQTLAINFRHYDDDTYPYVYSHTQRGAHEMLAEVERIAGRAGKPGKPGVAVTSPDYWPLPWYFRDNPHVGYESNVGTYYDPKSTLVVIGKEDQLPQLQSVLAGSYRRVGGVYPLRPGVRLVLFARSDLIAP